MQRVSAFSMPVVAQIYQHFGEVNILFKNKVVNLDQEFKNDSLQQHGIDYHVGQLGVSADESLFINTAGQSTSLLHKWRQFMRAKESDVSGGTSSLLRCLNGLHCEPWGDSALQFDRAWSMTEVGDDKFIINDTARHQIHLVDQQGGLLDTLKGFRFPNHVFKHQGSYWVVNTNTHGFVELEIGKELKKTSKEIFVNAYSDIPDHYRFPSIAYSHNDRSIITLVHPNGMNQGQVFQLENGAAKQLFENLEDITTIYLSNNKLYVADYTTMSIWQQDMISGDRQRLQSDSFDNAIAANKQLIDKEWRDFLLLAALVIGVGLLALVYALMKSTPIKALQVRTFLNDLEPIETGGEIRWVELDAGYAKQFRLTKKFIKFQFIAVPALLFLTFASVVLIQGFSLAALSSLARLVFYCAMAMVLIWFVFAEVKQQRFKKLGWDGESLYFESKHKRVKSQPKQVFFSKDAIYSKGIWLPIQKFNRQFLDKNSFETLIAPTLLEENKLSPYQLFSLRLKEGGYEVRRELTMIVLAFIALMIMVLIR